MVGASLAVALEGLGVRTALIEAVPHDAAAQPSFDERTTALSNGSRRILETLGVWPDVAAAATPIAKIHVSDQGHFGFARIDAAEQGRKALGYVVPNRALGRRSGPRLSRRARPATCSAPLGVASRDRMSAPVNSRSDRRRAPRRPLTRTPGGRRRRHRLRGARGVRCRCRVARLRADGDHHDRAAAQVSRARGLRALHSPPVRSRSCRSPTAAARWS